MNKDRDPSRNFESLFEKARSNLFGVRRVLEDNTVLSRPRVEELRARVDSVIYDLEAFAERVREMNSGLVRALTELRQEAIEMSRELNALTSPPHGIAAVLIYGGKEVSEQRDDEGHLHREEKETFWVYVGARLLRVHITDKVFNQEKEKLVRGRFVMMNEHSNIVAVASDELQDVLTMAGEEVTIDEILDEHRVRFVTRLDEKHIALIPKTWPAEIMQSMRVGDKWLLPQAGSGMFLGGIAALPKHEISELLLEEVPGVTYEKIGGLGTQISKIRDAIELPYLYPDLFRRLEMELSKGIMLYGPPGCGKTLIAKAVANGLASRLANKLGKSIKGYFINIKGPEILNKYVGETERKIREIFQRAKEKASEDHPVIIFLDEAESVLRTRGRGISSDIETTIVPQFLVMLDGIETLANVIIILASNRHDLIDPAVLRPGRVDIKIRIDRPDQDGAKEIFSIYVTKNLPLHPKYQNPKHPKFSPSYQEWGGKPELIIEHIITEAVKRLWATNEEPYQYRDASGALIKADNKLMDVVLHDGAKLPIYLKDLVSGAMIKSIVERAKKHVVKRAVSGGEFGLTALDFCVAVSDEMDENEELPNTLDDAQMWLAMQGRRERIVGVTPNLGRKKKKEASRTTETISGGQYL
ncbi:MAG: proteasome ATPase [Candidatus Sungiibacteriota bacterium]|uniref:Proteasome ATPase n=1 Tax=Candidatus Sungiibacteriota bacterium TaxID=2750080 RepID=A0A7T5RK57_9BACT|nr:MAG: proteasome ATPase [Candidatus Sungbacteria bacterium]